MLVFLIDNIFVGFGGRVYQQTVGIHNCAPFHTDLSLYSYEAVFIQGLLKKNEKKLARTLNFTFCYIDRIYPIELEIKDTTYTVRSSSYFDLCIEIDSADRLKLKIYDKRDDFHFPIVNFPFVWSNIQADPAYGVYISQLIRYSRVCGSYRDFHDGELLLTRKLLNQGFLWVKLKSSLLRFYGRDRYRMSVSQMTTDMFRLL